MVNFSCLISDSSIRLIQSFERRQIRTELRQLTTVFEKILIPSSYLSYTISRWKPTINRNTRPDLSDSLVHRGH